MGSRNSFFRDVKIKMGSKNYFFRDVKIKMGCNNSLYGSSSSIQRAAFLRVGNDSDAMSNRALAEVLNFFPWIRIIWPDLIYLVQFSAQSLAKKSGIKYYLLFIVLTWDTLAVSCNHLRCLIPSQLLAINLHIAVLLLLCCAVHVQVKRAS